LLEEILSFIFICCLPSASASILNIPRDLKIEFTPNFLKMCMTPPP
jgi:hypothetical protein